MQIKRSFLHFAIPGTAIFIATWAAVFSIIGLSKLFSNASIWIIFMASGLEIGKLVIVSYLYTFWKKIHWLHKTYLLPAVIGVMLLTSLGIYGFLSNAYQNTANKLEQSEKMVQLIDIKKTTFNNKINTLTERIKTKNERNILLSSLRTSQERRLDSLYIKNTWNSQKATKAIELNIEQANFEIIQNDNDITNYNNQLNLLQDSLYYYDNKKVEAQNIDVASDLGPLKYISKLTGWSMDKVANYLIFLLIFIFDPFAIALVVAANHLNKISKESINDNQLQTKKIEDIKTEPTSEELLEQIEFSKKEHARDLINEFENELTTVPNEVIEETIVKVNDIEPNIIPTENELIEEAPIVINDIKTEHESEIIVEPELPVETIIDEIKPENIIEKQSEPEKLIEIHPHDGGIRVL